MPPLVPSEQYPPLPTPFHSQPLGTSPYGVDHGPKVSVTLDCMTKLALFVNILRSTSLTVH